jgi:archaemetzincin
MATAVVIHPFGKIAEPLLSAVRAAARQRFGLRAAIGEELAMPAQAYSREREQYLSTSFLDLLTERTQGKNQILLGVTSVDLYVPELNFVFGEASGVDRVAVFSVARLDPRFYGGPEDEEILLRRAVTEAVHELGHVFGLGHCARPDCVMWFSNTLAETDRKGGEFCPRCARSLGLSGSRR